MTTKEFDNYNRGIAYHVERFNRGEISKEELYEAMQVQIGVDAFEAAKEIMDKRSGGEES